MKRQKQNTRTGPSSGMAVPGVRGEAGGGGDVRVGGEAGVG